MHECDHLAGAKRSLIVSIAHVKQPFKNEKKVDELCLKLPPEALIFRNMGTSVSMDPGELARAQWFWERRPKKFILSTEKAIGTLIFYVGIWVAAMFLNQQGLEMTVVVGMGCTFVAAMPVWAYLNARRFARWASDYRCAIFRLYQTVRR
jgi:hypothetical protein